MCKTKISHLFALLTLAVAAVLIENAFLQSIAINNQAYDLIAKTTINEVSPQNFSLMKAADKVALTGASVPLFPGAERLSFGDSGLIRYRINASAGKVANFYNQIMSLKGWSQVKNSGQKLAEKENLDRIIIALAENPITKKTEAFFYNKPAGVNNIFSVGTASAEEAALQPSVQPLQPVEPQQPLSPTNNQGAPSPDQPQYPSQPSNPQPPQYNNDRQGMMNTMEFSRPQNGGDGQQGPSEEQQKKMDEQRLKDMKRGMNQFSRSIKMMKKSVAKTKAVLSKCGVSIPEELTNALDSADGLAAKINDAKTADELDEVINDVQDVGSVMQDWGPRMGQLSQLCQMFKQADRDLKQLDRSLASYQKKNSAKMDISEILAAYKLDVDAMRQTLAQAKELAKTDPDEALSKLEDDFYGNMDNVRNSEQAISMVLNINKGIRQAASEIKKIESNIKNLKKRKKDTSAIEALTAQFKTQMEEVKSLIKTKFDADELIDKIESVFDAREQISDAMQEFGIGMMAPQIKENKNMNINVNLPDAFRKQPDDAGDSSGQEN